MDNRTGGMLKGDRRKGGSKWRE